MDSTALVGSLPLPVHEQDGEPGARSSRPWRHRASPAGGERFEQGKVRGRSEQGVGKSGPKSFKICNSRPGEMPRHPSPALLPAQLCQFPRVADPSVRSIDDRHVHSTGGLGPNLASTSDTSMLPDVRCQQRSFRFFDIFDLAGSECHWPRGADPRRRRRSRWTNIPKTRKPERIRDTA